MSDEVLMFVGEGAAVGMGVPGARADAGAAEAGSRADVAENTDVWVVRAACCELLALTLRYPDGVLAEAVASGEWTAAALEIAEMLGLALSDGFGEGLAGGDSATLLRMLRPEATRLFVGAPDPACSPYEGVWRAGDDGVKPLLFVNPHSMEVERFCHACGLGRPEGTNEPLDHIATELELLQCLAARQAGLVVAGAGLPRGCELPGGSPAAAYAQFMAEHVRTWALRFADSLGTVARHPLYRAASQLLATFVREDAVSAATA